MHDFTRFLIQELIDAQTAAIKESIDEETKMADRQKALRETRKSSLIAVGELQNLLGTKK